MGGVSDVLEGGMFESRDSGTQDYLSRAIFHTETLFLVVKTEELGFDPD